MPSRILAINPWIYDFAAYDMWARPLGLLYVAAALERAGADVRLIDCLDRYHPDVPTRGRGKASEDAFGCGHFASTVLPKPDCLRPVPRRWRRYGIPLDSFRQALVGSPAPDAVLVTSMMTYWYPGVIECVRLVREQWAEVPVLLGGVYATLCEAHARVQTGVDEVIPSGSLREVVDRIGQWCDLEERRLGWPAECPPHPAYHLWGDRRAVAVMTGFGCPFRCTYCASHLLQPRTVRFPAQYVLEELAGHVRCGTRNVAFYDDALLVDFEGHLGPILEGVVARGLKLRLHTPNGIHPRYVTAEAARWMKRAGFETLRLSFESASAERQRDSSGKVTSEELGRAVEHFRSAGFGPEQIGVYALMGLPGQERDEVAETLREVRELRATSHLARFAPIPKTVEFDRWLAGTGADPGQPLLHNNTAQPYLFPHPLTAEDYEELGRLSRRLNGEVSSAPDAGGG